MRPTKESDLSSQRSLTFFRRLQALALHSVSNEPLVVSIKTFGESQEHKNESCDDRPGEHEAREKALVTLGGEPEPQLPYQDTHR
jgi:hypothetical protein